MLKMQKGLLFFLTYDHLKKNPSFPHPIRQPHRAFRSVIADKDQNLQNLHTEQMFNSGLAEQRVAALSGCSIKYMLVWQCVCVCVAGGEWGGPHQSQCSHA